MPAVILTHLYGKGKSELGGAEISGLAVRGLAVDDQAPSLLELRPDRGSERPTLHGVVGPIGRPHRFDDVVRHDGAVRGGTHHTEAIESMPGEDGLAERLQS